MTPTTQTMPEALNMYKIGRTNDNRKTQFTQLKNDQNTPKQSIYNSRCAARGTTAFVSGQMIECERSTSSLD